MVGRLPGASGATILLVAAPGAHAALREALDAEHHVIAAAGPGEAEDVRDLHVPDLLLLDPAVVAGQAGDDVVAALQRLGVDELPTLLLGIGNDVPWLDDALAQGVRDVIASGTPTAIARRRVAHQLDLRYCHELLAAQSRLDGASGIANRARFDEFLEAAFANAQRRREPIALVLLDIDAFGAYNTALGHAAGDEVLLHIGRALACARRRPFDLFARHADDGFAAVLPDTTAEGARTVAELVSADVDALQLDHPASPVAAHVTVSIGIAACIPDAQDTPAQLVERALAALDRAKQDAPPRISD